MATTQEIKVKDRTTSISAIKKAHSTYLTIFRLLEIGAHIFFYTIRYITRSLFNLFRKTKRSRQALLGQTVAELCESLGATFIKMGQILSTRRDLLPQDFIQPLIRLQDKIKPFDFKYVSIIIQEQTGRSLTDIFAAFETQPVSSASIASVYRARLHNGEWVAVKIRRPDIVRKVRDDLRLMRSMARLIARIPSMKLIPVVDMINDLGTVIEEQVDLRIEVQNTKHFYKLFAENPHVKIPAVVEEYCTEAIIVMEFIDNLIRIDALDWTEEEYQQSLMTGLRALYRMIFLDGFIHCDLHPGNLYLLKGGHIVLLDNGFVSKFHPDDRYEFAEFFLGIATNDGKGCAKIIYKTASLKPKTFDYETFEQAVIELIDRNVGSKAESFQVAPFVYEIFDIQRRFGLRGSTTFTMAILSLLMFEGIAKQLHPQLDFQMAARPFLFRAMSQKRLENQKNGVSPTSTIDWSKLTNKKSVE